MSCWIIVLPVHVCCCVVVSCLVAQSCPTLRSPMDCSPPVSSVHWILQARILEWGAISSSRWSFWPRDQTHVSYICIGKRVLYQQCHLGSHIFIHVYCTVHGVTKSQTRLSDFHFHIVPLAFVAFLSYYIQKIVAQDQCQRVPNLCLRLGVLWFQVLCLSL